MSELAYHTSIREHLGDLAELDEMVGPSELISGWFTDLYFPAEKSCPRGYPQETWDRGQREWRECFNSSELEALAEFHAVFERHLPRLSQEWPDWKADPGWHAVRDAARVAIERFDAAA